MAKPTRRARVWAIEERTKSGWVIVCDPISELPLVFETRSEAVVNRTVEGSPQTERVVPYERVEPRRKGRR